MIEDKTIDEHTSIVDEVLQKAGNRSGSREELIPVLLNIQRKIGYLPEYALKKVSETLSIPATDIWSVVTFYNEFRLVPRGKHHIRVCLGTACYVKGSNTILQIWEKKLGIRCGEVTQNLEFGLETVGCVGCCCLAPVTVINEQVHGAMTPTKVEGLLLKMKR